MHTIYFKHPVTGESDSADFDPTGEVKLVVDSNTTETKVVIESPAGESEPVEHIGNEPKPKS